MSRAAWVLAVVVLAATGVVGAIAFFNARDDAGVAVREEGGPGVPRARVAPLTEGLPRLAPGNVLVAYAEPGHREALMALRDELAGPPSRALVDAGQAVVLRRSARFGHGVLALGGDRALSIDDPRDPRLRAFVEYWLGRAQ